MTVFDRQIALVKKTIAAKGEPCEWTHHALTTPDATKPWNPGDDTTGVYPVNVLWDFNASMRVQFTNRAVELPAGAKVGIISAQQFVPMIQDTITRGDGSVWTVDVIDTLDPDGAPILYYVTVHK